MELRVLRYFLKVVQEGNISKAAQALHVTQPTLSRQLMSLEDELNTKLFIRGKREITLTEDGVVFLQRAHEIVELADKIKEEFVLKEDQIKGRIAIGCVETQGSKLLAEFITEFHRKYPKVKFDIVNADSDMILYKIDKGLVDIGCLVEPADYTNHDSLKLPVEDVWGILVQKNDPIVKKGKVTIEELEKMPLGIPRRDLMYHTVLDWFKDKSSLDIVVRFTLLSNIVYLVADGMVNAITLDGALSYQNSNEVAFIPIVPKIKEQSVLVWKKNRFFSPIASLFIHEAQEFFKQRLDDTHENE